MTNGTSDRFTPHGEPSRETLLAYVQGRLAPTEAHAVESHLEADPLLRDAVDGLRMPGALGGLERLRAQAPNANAHTWIGWSLSALVVLVTGVTVSHFTGDAPRTQDQMLVAAHPAVPAPTPVTTTPDTTVLLDQEIATGVEIPESLRIGHASTERHSLAQVNHPARTHPVERTSLDAVEPKRTEVQEHVSVPVATPERQQKSSLQLVYLHDLKLLHPKEMYDRSPDIDLFTRSIDARFETSMEQDAARGEEIRMTYLAFMDEALDKFVQGDHKGCLEELRYVLNQYPNDVNALFYAGLCAYNLGLSDRAERFLARAAAHSFRVFDEEAEWYHALAMERNGKEEDARSAYERIARSNSFYAPRAQEKQAR